MPYVAYPQPSSFTAFAQGGVPGGANQPPAAPTVTSATVTAGILTLTGSAFSDPDGNAHAASQWQVQRAGGDWSAPLFDSGQDAQHRTVLTVDVSAWAPGDYVARVRYLDDAA